MAVGFNVDCLWYQVGHGDLLHSFFSTISYNLEKDGWGSRYPLLMNHLYNGKLSWQSAQQAIEETINIKDELKLISVDKVIWDINDLTKKPPWGENISREITNLSNYFITSDGRYLIDILLKALDDSWNENIDIEVISI